MFRLDHRGRLVPRVNRQKRSNPRIDLQVGPVFWVIYLDASVPPFGFWDELTSCIGGRMDWFFLLVLVTGLSLDSHTGVYPFLGSTIVVD